MYRNKIISVIFVLIMTMHTGVSALTYDEWKNQTTDIDLYDMNYRNVPFSIDVNTLGGANIYVVNNMAEFMRMFEMLKRYKTRGTYIYIYKMKMQDLWMK